MSQGELTIKRLKATNQLLLVQERSPGKYRALALLLVDIDEFAAAITDFWAIELDEKLETTEATQ